MKTNHISGMALAIPIAFPSEFKRPILRSMDRRFWSILLVSAVLGLGWLYKESLAQRKLDFGTEYVVRKIQTTKVVFDPKTFEPVNEEKVIEKRIEEQFRSMDVQQRRQAYQEYLRQRADNRHAEIENRLRQRMNDMRNLLQTSGNRFLVVGSENSQNAYTEFTSLQNGTEEDGNRRNNTNIQLSQNLTSLNLETTDPRITSNIQQTSDHRLVVPTPQLDAGANFAGLRSADVMSKISSCEGSIQNAYSRLLKRNPDLKGKIAVRISIDKSGRVAKCIVEMNTTGSAELEREIVSKMRGLRFQAGLVKSGQVTISQTFIFGK